MRRAELRTFRWRCGAGKRTRRRSCTGAQTSCVGRRRAFRRERSAATPRPRPRAADGVENSVPVKGSRARYSTGSKRHGRINCELVPSLEPRKLRLTAVSHRAGAVKNNVRPTVRTILNCVRHRDSTLSHIRARLSLRAAVLASSGLVIPPSLGSSAAASTPGTCLVCTRDCRVQTRPRSPGRSSSDGNLPAKSNNSRGQELAPSMPKACPKHAPAIPFPVY